MANKQVDIPLKSPEQLALMRAAGVVVADTLAAVRQAALPGVTTADLDLIAERTIREQGAIPSFKGYQGFPASICASVNEQVVHGIPSEDQVLAEGDILSVDCGAVLNGWQGDAAVTIGVGAVCTRARRLVQATEDALWAGIRAAARGVRSGRGRLTDISHAVESSARRSGPYGIVQGYGGHGIGMDMHEDPFVMNSGRPGQGPPLLAGMALAIEPMLTLGKGRTLELSDGWTVVTADRSLSAHAEHTVALCPDGVWVLTAADGGRGRLGHLVSAQHDR